jgi:alkylated DNA repair dioxygenase AlkB
MSAAELTIDRAAPVTRTPLGETAWVEVATGFVRDAAAVYDELVAGVGWQQSELLRYDHYVPDRRLGAVLRADSSPLLRQTTLHLESRYRVRPTGVSALWYRNGDDFQGLHSDREMQWLDDTIIAIVVLGTRRPFVLRPRGDWRAAQVERIPAGTGPDDVVLLPGAGDLLVMGGAAQRDWLHGVPAAHTDEGRISLTWRWSSRRGRPDPAPSYDQTFQFTDRRPTSGRRFRPG